MSIASRFSRPSWMPKYVPRAGDGCVLWLPGQDDPKSATIRDRSGNRNNGAISGATWGRNSKGLWVLDFDGTDDWVNCGTSTSLNPTTAFTILAWIKRDAIGNMNICSQGTLGVGWMWEFYSNDRLRFYGQFGGGGYGSKNGSTAYNDITAYHLYGVVYDNTNLTFYYDGVAKTPIATTGALSNDTGDTFKLGAREYAGANDVFLNGQMGLFIMASSAFTAAQITNIRNQDRHLFGV